MLPVRFRWNTAFIYMVDRFELMSTTVSYSVVERGLNQIVRG